MNPLATNTILSRAVFSFAPGETPVAELSWLEKAISSPNSWVAAAAGFAAVLLLGQKLLGPTLLRREEARLKREESERELIDQATENQRQLPRDVSDLREDLKLLARVQERILQVIEVGCGKHFPPMSDTDLQRLDEIRHGTRKKNPEKQ